MAASQLVWLRRDLRLNDNPAFYEAQQQGDIHVVYVATPTQWQSHDEAPAKLGLIAAILRELAAKLAQLGIPFSLLEADTFKEVPQALLSHCKENALHSVWFNGETPLDEYNRDQAVTKLLHEHDIHTTCLPADLIVANNLLTQQAQPYKVFTPYYRAWQEVLETQIHAPYAPPKQQGDSLTVSTLNMTWAGDYRTDLWPHHEKDVLEKLSRFCEQKLERYKDFRDFPAKPATSLLSPHLALGQIGPRTLVSEIQTACHDAGRAWRSDDWLRELAWRDFYRQLMTHFPELSKNKPFKPETESIVWQNNQQAFVAWCEGQTGFPIIDAAMRQLNQTGWMHNRLRMLTASFLSKLLLIDWRWGQRYFMQHLIDGDFASNNGGWQWSASTGVDAAPYFRIFNPVSQSEKFDPDAQFIKKFVLELADIEDKSIHFPSAKQRSELGYAAPIVDYKQARQQALEAFSATKTSSMPF